MRRCPNWDTPIGLCGSGEQPLAPFDLPAPGSSLQTIPEVSGCKRFANTRLCFEQSDLPPDETKQSRDCGGGKAAGTSRPRVNSFRVGTARSCSITFSSWTPDRCRVATISVACSASTPAKPPDAPT